MIAIGEILLRTRGRRKGRGNNFLGTIQSQIWHFVEPTLVNVKQSLKDFRRVHL